MNKLFLLVLILVAVACQKSTESSLKSEQIADQNTTTVGENAESAVKHVGQETKAIAVDASDKTVDSAKKVGSNAASAGKYVGKETKSIVSKAAEKTAESAKKVGKNAASAVKQVANDVNDVVTGTTASASPAETASPVETK